MVAHDKAIQRALQLLDAATTTESLLESAADPGLSDWLPVPKAEEGGVDPMTTAAPDA
jgi:hypothetical protein